jgi:hypothetical protein
VAHHQQQQQLVRRQQQPHRDAYEDPEVKQRTAAWTQLLASMRSNPDPDEFVYLKYAWPDQMPLNPFDLQPCSHADACKQPRHFTLSPAGVTAYFSDGTPAEFLTLDAFQREFLLHQQLMRLPLFRHFRCVMSGLGSSCESRNLMFCKLSLSPALHHSRWSICHKRLCMPVVVKLLLSRCAERYGLQGMIIIIIILSRCAVADAGSP